MADLFASGHAADLVLFVLLLELLVMMRWPRQTAAPQRRRASLIIAALPGVCLVLALRAALTGADWQWVALWLALSFPAHIADLRRRPVA